MSQGSSEKINTYDHGGWHVPRAAGSANNLETQKSQWFLVPGQVRRPEIQESGWCSFHLKASRLEAQEKPMLPFESKSRKKVDVPVQRLSGSKEFSSTRGMMNFSFSSGLSLIE